MPETASRTKEEIFARFVASGVIENHTGPPVDIYYEEPVLSAPHGAGQLTAAFIRQGVAEANFVRYLAGLPADLVSDHTLNGRGQHGAALLAAEVQLTTFPARAEGMTDDFFELALTGTNTANLSWGARSLHEAVRAYMYNSEQQCISELGHRRWILNPSLLRIGFGYVNRFAAMQVVDRSRRESVGYEMTAWPAAGYFPLEYMTGNQAWSLSLNPLVYDNTRTDNIYVVLTRNADGERWHFTPSNADPEGKFFNVSTHGYGVPFCVIFRPDGIDRYNADESFTIEVMDVTRRDGVLVNITYDVTFFQLYASLIMTLGDDTAVSVTGNFVELLDLGAPPVTDGVTGRTLVPLETVVGYMGGSVVFHEAEQTIMVFYRDNVIELGVNRRRAVINGTVTSTDAMPQIIDGTLKVPVRFISETLGARVHWCNDTQSVTVIYMP
jgi:hypothetical protein